MNQHIASPSAPPRDTIIFDPNMLRKLAAILPPKFMIDPQAKNPARLWHALPELGKGFDIVVPEIASFFACQTLHDGFSTTQYFDHTNKPLYIIMAHLLSRSMNMGILKVVEPPSQDATRTALFIREIFEIHKSNIPDSQKVLRIVAARKKKLYDGISSEDAVIEILRTYGDTPRTVLYISDHNIGARSMLNYAAQTHHDLKIVTATDFIGGLARTGLLEKANINPIAPEKFRQPITDFLSDQDEFTLFLEDPFFTNEKSRASFAAHIEANRRAIQSPPSRPVQGGTSQGSVRVFRPAARP